MDKIPNRLIAIRGEMSTLVGPTDIEIAHAEADDLLVEVVKLLASRDNAGVQQVVADILAAYESIDKWYA